MTITTLTSTGSADVEQEEVEVPDRKRYRGEGTVHSKGFPCIHSLE